MQGRAFSDKDSAGKAAAERQSALAELLKARLVVMKGNGEADDTGMSFGEALAGLGILKFSTMPVAVEVEDQRIVLAGPGQMPPPRLVVP